MRLTKEQTAENRRLILEAASKLFREKGYDGVGIADVMEAAGFTHGGFYNHFSSKEALIAETCACAMSASAENAEREDFAIKYLASSHLKGFEKGCFVAALAGDAARQSVEVQTPFVETIEQTVNGLVTATGATREDAIRQWSELVGSLILSRAINKANPVFAQEILDATRHSLAKPPKKRKKRKKR